MTDYLDHNLKKLEKGFYIHVHPPCDFYFFTGYDEDNFANFENCTKNGEKVILPSYLTKRLKKMTKEKVEKEIKILKDKTNFLEKRLEEI